MSVLADHPVTSGRPRHYEIVDELYLGPVLSKDVIPLLRINYDFTERHFYSALQALAGKMHSRSGWSHPDGSPLVGWVKHWGNSPIVYLQGGDDSNALANPHFQQLVHNAIAWVASRAAKDWARQRNQLCEPKRGCEGF